MLSFQLTANQQIEANTLKVQTSISKTTNQSNHICSHSFWVTLMRTALSGCLETGKICFPFSSHNKIIISNIPAASLLPNLTGPLSCVIQLGAGEPALPGELPSPESLPVRSSAENISHKIKKHKVMSLTDMQACFQHAPVYYVCDEVFSLIILYVTLVKW